MTQLIAPFCPLVAHAAFATSTRVRSRAARRLPAFLAIILTLTCTSPLRADDATLDQLRQENERLRARVQDLETQVRRLTEKTGQLQSQKQRAERRAQDLEVRQQTVIAETEALYVTCNHDAEAVVTTCRTKWMPLMVTHGRKRHHWFRLVSARNENDPRNSKGKVTIDFKTRASGGIYRSVSNLQLNLDGQSLARPVLNYESRRRTGSGSRTKVRRDNESFSAALTVEDLRTIVQARSVEGRLGAVRFGFPPDQIHACKVMLRKLRPPTRSSATDSAIK